MKKSLLFALLLAGFGAFAQAPNQMNYQGVARNSAGAPLATTPIGLKLSVHDGSATGAIVYEETQSPTTNAFGLYNVAIGTGSVTSGTWAGISWATGNKYLEVSLDPAGGSAYTSLGTSQLLSSAYALYANNAGSATTATTATTAGTITGTVPMGGDVTGTNAAATVVKLQGRNVSATAPTTGQVLQWTGTAWTPAATGGTGTVTSIATTAPLTGGPITTSGTIGMATSGVTAGSYGTATMVPQINIDVYGRVTSASNVAISAGSGTVTSVTAGAGLSGGTITTTGTISMPTVGTAGTYGDATHYPQITTDAYGRVSAVNVFTVTSSTGTTNYIPKFNSSTSIGNSGMYQNGTKVGLGTITPRATYEAGSTTDSMAGWFYSSTASPAALHGIVEVDYSGTTNSGTALIANANNVPTNNNTYGIKAYGTSIGVSAQGLSTLASGSASVRGMEGAGFGSDQYAMGVGAYGNRNTAGGIPLESYGIVANATGGTTNYSGYFFGDVYVGGSLSKASGTFKIDHPQDPENKYLYHSFVESPDMMNIYNGNIITDGSGVAEVALPDYFQALNQDFRYQLTVIGTFAQAIVSKEISANKFEVKTSVPNVKVSWQVTGVRHDAYANANRVVPEVNKESYNKGKFLNPKELGKSESLRIGSEISKATTQQATETTTRNK